MLGLIQTGSIDIARTATAALALASALSLSSASPARAQGPRLSVGVLPFDATQADTMLRPLGYGIADLIATDFATIRRLRVVERLRLGDVLR